MLKFDELKGNRVTAAVLSVLCAACVLLLSLEFLTMREGEPLYPGLGVTRTFMLSDYFDGIRGTAGDTEVYVLKGEKPGPSMLVLGGTHPNEPSGYLAAVLLLENAVVEEGTLYVIPRTNNSAFTCNDPQEAAPMRFQVDTPAGPRTFRFGSRATNPIHQWPDPEIYLHVSSGQQLSGAETRNINRTYPGRPNGNLTEQVSYAVTRMIRAENITVTVDLHEAAPEYPTINALVTHERALSLASSGVFNMMLEGMDIALEPSPQNLHGLTHRELGDFTDTLAVLMETANPSQGRLRGKTNETLVVTGRDKFYERAAVYGRLYVPFDPNGHPLHERVSRQITGVMQLALSCEETGLGRLVIGGVPSYNEMNENGIGQFLAPRG